MMGDGWLMCMMMGGFPWDFPQSNSYQGPEKTPEINYTIVMIILILLLVQQSTAAAVSTFRTPINTEDIEVQPNRTGTGICIVCFTSASKYIVEIRLDTPE